MPKKHTFILCDGNRVNSYGFRTDLAGLDLERFKSNPVMLYAHDSSDVIGRWENIRVEDNQLKADAVFDTDDEQGKRIAGKVERGFLKGCSMGIHVKELHEVDNVPVATRSELMEASVCPIPSDAGAVRLYDENRKELTFEEVRLQFNNQLKPIEMNKNEETNVQTPAADPKDAEIASLKAQLAESKKREVDSFLTAAVQSGKITTEEKEGFAKLAANDFETVQSLINSRPAKASTTLRELHAQASTAVPAGRENWNYLEWMKKDPEGLKRMKTENPTEFERLQNTLKK
jgi:HK97 family phage prohead protease